jgi:hypothetical protein
VLSHPRHCICSEPVCSCRCLCVGAIHIMYAPTMSHYCTKVWVQSLESFVRPGNTLQSGQELQALLQIGLRLHCMSVLQFKIEPFKHPVKMDPEWAGNGPCLATPFLRLLWRSWDSLLISLQFPLWMSVSFRAIHSLTRAWICSLATSSSRCTRVLEWIVCEVIKTVLWNSFACEVLLGLVIFT